MNQTTEPQAVPSIKTARLQTIVVWSLIVACGILFPSALFRSYAPLDKFFLTPFPWVVVGGMTIDQGLQMFSGTIPALSSITTQLSCLLSIVIVFVICPTLFFFGLKARAVERASGKELPLLRRSTLLFVLGGMMVLGPALISIPMALIQRSVSSSLHDAQGKSETKDAIMYELSSVAAKLYEYRVLPKELGGGNGSFAGFTLPKDLASTNEAQYTVELQDSLAIAKATSAKYPLGTITAKISNKGRFVEWKYSEVFE